MRCETCEFLLDVGDNYCRKCGESVKIALLPAVRTVQPPALFRSTAAPLATGAAAVAATAVLRWAVGQAVRSLVAGGRSKRIEPTPRRVLSRRESVSAGQSRDRGVVEIFWYRRTAGE